MKYTTEMKIKLMTYAYLIDFLGKGFYLDKAYRDFIGIQKGDLYLTKTNYELTREFNELDETLKDDLWNEYLLNRGNLK